MSCAILWGCIAAAAALAVHSYYSAGENKYVALTAWSTILLALFTVEAIGRQIKIARQTAQVEVLMRHLDKFDSQPFIRARIEACTAANLEFGPVYVGDGDFPAQERLLDFFESIGRYARRGIIDITMLESELGFLMAGYKQILKGHANHLGMNWGSKDLYEDFGYVVSQFSPPELSEMQLGRFLSGEIGLREE
jgi:hypothetical protein